MSTYTGTIPALPALHAPSASELANYHDALTALTDQWTPYTPTWTGGTPAIGNGTLAGAYIQIGKFVVFRINMVAGSTTTFGSGAWTIGLPVSSNVATGQRVGGATLNDSSATTNRMGRSVYTNGVQGVALVDEATTRVGSATPFAWATGDQWTVEGVYEAS